MKYFINDIKLFGHHGVYEEEKTNGQYFYINISYEVIHMNTYLNDNINDAVDYIDVKKKIEDVFKSNRYNLLETLIKDISVRLSNSFSGISNINIKISKKIKDGTRVSVIYAPE